MRPRSYLQRLASPAPVEAQLFVVPTSRPNAVEPAAPSYVELAAQLRRFTDPQHSSPQPSVPHREEQPAVPAATSRPRLRTDPADRAPMSETLPVSRPLGRALPLQPQEALRRMTELPGDQRPSRPGVVPGVPHAHDQQSPAPVTVIPATAASVLPVPVDAAGVRPVEVHIGTIEVRTRERPQQTPGPAAAPPTPAMATPKTSSAALSRGYSSDLGLAQR